MSVVTVAVDAMGGDNAPYEIIKGAVDAVNSNKEVKVILVGIEDVINNILKDMSYDKDSIEVVDAPEVIATDDPPVMSIRKKKNSSIVVGQTLVKEGKADGFVSSGSTGAVLVGAQLIVGRLKGVERPPLAPLIPTKKGFSLLLDCGANVDARPSHLLQFAKLGSIYMEHCCGVKNPTVGILNIGAEEEKGNMLVKETFPLLKNCPDINFVGSVEARDVPYGGVDVIVCEAFAGNVFIKTFEGTGGLLIGEVTSVLKSSPITMIGAALIKKALKKTLKKYDAHEYGGAPMLGLNGLVVKSHGSAKAKEICTSINQCVTFSQTKINDIIKEKINFGGI